MDSGRTAVDLGRVGRLVRWIGGIALGVGVVGFVGHEAIYADDPSPVSPAASATDGDPEPPTEVEWTTIRIKGFRFDVPSTTTVESDPTMGVWNRNWNYDAPPETAIALSMIRSSQPLTEADLRQIMLRAVPQSAIGDIRTVDGPGTVNLAHRYRKDGS